MKTFVDARLALIIDRMAVFMHSDCWRLGTVLEYPRSYRSVSISKVSERD